MGRRILLWFGGAIFFLVVAAVAMMPLEEDGAMSAVSGEAVSAAPVPTVVSTPNEEAEVQQTPGVTVSAAPTAPESGLTVESTETPEPVAEPTPEPTPELTLAQADYVLNTNSEKFHVPTCSSVSLMNESNKQLFVGTREEVVAQGFEPCKNCNP